MPATTPPAAVIVEVPSDGALTLPAEVHPDGAIIRTRGAATVYLTRTVLRELLAAADAQHAPSTVMLDGGEAVTSVVVTCSWCHHEREVCPGVPAFCGRCGHRADLCRSRCNCGRCVCPVRHTLTAEDVDAAGTALEELAQARKDRES